MNIKVGIRKEVLNLVDPRFQTSILEDGGGFGRVQGHDGPKQGCPEREKRDRVTVRRQ